MEVGPGSWRGPLHAAQVVHELVGLHRIGQAPAAVVHPGDRARHLISELRSNVSLARRNARAAKAARSLVVVASSLVLLALWSGPNVVPHRVFLNGRAIVWVAFDVALLMLVLRFLRCPRRKPAAAVTLEERAQLANRAELDPEPQAVRVAAALLDHRPVGIVEEEEPLLRLGGGASEVGVRRGLLVGQEVNRHRRSP